MEGSHSGTPRLNYFWLSQLAVLLYFRVFKILLQLEVLECRKPALRTVLGLVVVQPLVRFDTQEVSTHAKLVRRRASECFGGVLEDPPYGSYLGKCLSAV